MFSLTFANPALLFGLPALAVPVIVHLLSRRQYVPVDWGAMQFLLECDETRRRSRLDQYLLLLLRVLLLGLLLLLLAGPTLKSRWLNRIANTNRKDAVVILDGSGSMALVQNRQSLFDLAKKKGRDYVGHLGSTDRYQVLLARRESSNLTGDWGVPWGNVERRLETETPYGPLDVPAAIQQAVEILKADPAAEREIVFFTDGQKRTWADPALRERLKSLTENLPAIRIIDAAPTAPDTVRNVGIAKVGTRRTLVARNQEVVFEGELTGLNRDPAEVGVQVLLDRRPIGQATVEKGNGRRAPFEFAYRFAEAGSHAVQFRLPADDYPVDDTFDIAVRAVSAIDVTIVDSRYGGSNLFSPSQFLADALAPPREPEPLFKLQRRRDAEAPSRSAEISARPRQRVTILCDPATPSAAQLGDYLSAVTGGAGLLIAAGDSFDPKTWRESEAGRTLLPAVPLQIVGDETQIEGAPRIDPDSLVNPAMKLFRDRSELLTAYFPKHWDLSTEGVDPSRVLAKLTNGKPFLVEKPIGLGRVILCAVPLDNRWRTNLTDLGDYVRLVNELTLYAASEAGAESNRPPGSRFALSERMISDAPLTITPPAGDPIRGRLRDLRDSLPALAVPGLYEVREGEQPPEYSVIQADPTENELTYARPEDWTALKEALGGKLLRNAEVLSEAGSAAVPGELSLRAALVLALLALLCGEAWLARRQSGA